MFQLDGMTGTFNQTVKNQIQGATSATTGPTASGTGATTVVTSTRGSSTSTTSRPANASASASNKNGTGSAFLSASPITYTGVAAFIGTVVGLFL